MESTAPGDNEAVWAMDSSGFDREQIEAARQQPLGEKLLAGIDLFELSCEFMRAGIRLRHPDATDDEVFALVEERLALARRLEAGGYGP